MLERELPEPRLAGGSQETELARKLREGEWVTCVELDPPKDEEVLVELHASGMCHSDEHLVTGGTPVELPVIARP